MGWVERLATVAQRNPSMKLATHLCERRVNDVFKGDDTFVETLQTMGFRRVQINATARNGADVSMLSSCVDNFAGLVRRHSKLGFLQPNRIQTHELSRRDCSIWTLQKLVVLVGYPRMCPYWWTNPSERGFWQRRDRKLRR